MIMSNKKIAFIVAGAMSVMIAMVFVFSTAAFSHSGGTDKNGCHKDHKRGGYHCHNPK